MTPIKQGGIGALIVGASLFIARFEGERLTPYYDQGGVLTICYGETERVQSDDVATHEECIKKLEKKTQQIISLVYNEIGVVPDKTAIALSSFCYNVGVGNCKRSVAFRKIKDGDELGGCQAILNWSRVGKNNKMLAPRRIKEKNLCVAGYLKRESLNEDQVKKIFGDLNE